MEFILELIRAYPIASTAIVSALSLLTLGQAGLWTWRLLSKGTYYRWLLNSNTLRNFCYSDYQLQPFRKLLLGSTVKGIELVAREKNERNETVLIKTIEKSRRNGLHMKAGKALGEIGSEKAIPILIGMLSGGYNWGMNVMVKEALLQITQDKALIGRYLVDAIDGSHRDAAIIKLMGELELYDTILVYLPTLEDNEALRLGIEYAGKSNLPLAVSTLMALDVTDNKVLLAKVNALRALNDPDVFHYLVGLTNHAAQNIRIAAIEALRTSKDPRAIESLKKLMGDYDEKVRFTTAIALKEYDTPEVTELFKKALFYDRKNENQYLTSIAERKDRSAIPGLMGFLFYPGTNFIRVIDCVKSIGGPEAGHALMAALRFHAKNDARAKQLVGALLELKDVLNENELKEVKSHLNTDYEPLEERDIQEFLKWLQSDKNLNVDYIKPTYKEVAVSGPYDYEDWGTESWCAKKGSLTLRLSDENAR